MTIAFTAAGRVPFRVTVTPTPVNLSRFARALFKSHARVSDSDVGDRSNLPWVAIVWLKPSLVPVFENICQPQGFVLLSNQEILLGGLKEPLDPT